MKVGAILEAIGSPALLCILGNHIFFNLKEAAAHGVNIGTNWSSYTRSAIQFDEASSDEFQCDNLTLRHVTLDVY